MKIAFAGKGGVGKTTLTAWTADYLARTGNNVWLVDADTALSLGQASGMSRDTLPAPLACREDLIRERIGQGMLSLTPDVGDLPEKLAIPLPLSGPALEGKQAGTKRLLVMGGLTHAGGGCACEANALLKSILAHLILERNDWVLVDLEAGVEHLGRGTVAHADGLIIVSEPSWRSLETAAQVAEMASSLGLNNQTLALNRTEEHAAVPDIPGLPETQIFIPALHSLMQRQMSSPSVLALPEEEAVFATISQLLATLQ